jgi:RHS repeat-associated protein
MEGETFTYDALGRRLQCGNTSYLYIGDEEIGAFENNRPKELKIAGVTPIAIEIGDKPYVPIQDAQGTIRFLVDPDTKEIVQQNDCDVFGAGLTDAIPYAYAGKRYDPKLGLVYFGKRYYDPSIRRWLTTDPIGPVDHSNLYQYVFNNPCRYQDPTGESIGGYLYGLGEIVLGGAIMAGGLGLEIVTCGGFTFGFAFAETAGAALIGHGLVLTTQNAQDLRVPNSMSKNSASPRNEKPNNAGGGSTGEVPNGILKPIGGAIGAHTVYKRDSKGKVTKYETF